MKWKYKTGKLRGAFGETDLAKKTITIDKSKHKRGANVKHLTKNDDGSEKMAVSIKHELLHKEHPTWTEERVEKKARSWVENAHKKMKQRLYAKFN